MFGRAKSVPQPEPGTVIQISWEDCYTEDKWTPVKDLLANKAYVIKTIGWFLGYAGTNDTLWVVTSGLTVGTDASAGATWFIPVQLIIDWEALT